MTDQISSKPTRVRVNPTAITSVTIGPPNLRHSFKGPPIGPPSNLQPPPNYPPPPATPSLSSTVYVSAKSSHIEPASSQSSHINTEEPSSDVPPAPTNIKQEESKLSQLPTKNFQPDPDAGIKNYDIINYYPTTVSPRFDLKYAERLYPESDRFKNNLKWLRIKNKYWRKVRKDGNCYYRAVGVSFLEHLCRLSTDISVFQNFIENLQTEQGYYANWKSRISDPQLYIEQLEFLLSLRIQLDNKKTFEQLERMLVDDVFDKATIKLMRHLTEVFLKVNASNPSISGFIDYEFFTLEKLLQDASQMDTEAEGLLLIALPNVLGCAVVVERTSEDADYGFDIINPWDAGAYFKLSVWFRPGHYDILGTAEQAFADGYDVEQGVYSNVSYNEVQKSVLRTMLGMSHVYT